MFLFFFFFFFEEEKTEIYIQLYTGVQGLATEKMRENIGNNKNLFSLSKLKNKRMKGDFNHQVSGCQPRRRSGHMVGGTVFGGIHGMNGPLE